MKRLLFATSLLLGLSILLSCEQKAAQEDLDDDIILVGVSVSYENLNFINEEPLSKAVEANGLYGIQVNEYINENDIWNSERYCFGLYDDIAQLKIQFKRNHKYFIRIDYFPNGKNELPYKSNGYSPLQVMPWNDVTTIPTINTITYSSYFCLDYVGSLIKEPYDRYMYWNENFVPKDNTPLPVHFLRMNAGLTFKLEKVEGFDFNTVQVKWCTWEQIYSKTIGSGANEIVIDKIVLGNHTWGEGGLPDLYYQEFEIGTPENPSLFYKGQIELKRNTMRTYSIKMESDTTINEMNVSYDSNTYEQDNGGYLN